MNIRDDIIKSAKDRIIILDGATGTLLPQSGDNPQLPDLFNLSHPDKVGKVHSSYLASGADIITTNTLNSNASVKTIKSKRVNIAEINRKAVSIAKRCISEFETGELRFCAGSVGPIQSEHESLDITQLYEKQFKALLENNIDILLLETMIKMRHIVGAIEAAKRSFAEVGRIVPIWISVAPVLEGGRIVSGENIEEILTELDRNQPLIFGLNCIDDFDLAEEILESIKDKSGLLLSFHPNAGIPDENGNYPLSTEEWVARMAGLCRKGLINIAGGCCGTTPEYIRLLSRELKNIPPRDFGPIRPDGSCAS